MKTIVRAATNGAVRTRTKFALWPIYNQIGKDDDGYALYERFWLQWVKITEQFRSGYDDYGWETLRVEALQ